MLNKNIGDLMTKDVVTVDVDEDVVFAFEKLMKEKISSMPVIKDDDIVGIVTATDLGHNLILDNYQLGTKVKDVMVKDVVTIDLNSTVSDAILLMYNRAPGTGIINQLPVVKDGKIVGILSDGDLIKFIGSEI